MRTIDADALKELFSEVIGRIAKKPEMNGNLEHMIRASAMVIQMIDDAPTVHPDTTTHDSISAKNGRNDGRGTSGDCISRQAAIEPEAISRWKKEFREYVDSLDIARDDWKGIIEYIDDLPPAQPDVIRCKDCKHRDPEDKKCDCGHDIQWQLPRQDNWYCADAERRTDVKTNKGASC